MFDWSKDNLESLAEIAHEAGQSEELRYFANYCLQESNRHETEAFENLRLFMNDVHGWTVKDKRDFVDWLLRIQHNHPTLHNIIHPTLHHELIAPIMQQWLKDAPEDARRLRWSSRLEDLERARALAPEDTVTQRRLVDLLIRRIKEDCGHPPEDYPGHPQEDAAGLDEAIALLEALPDLTRHDRRMLDEAKTLRQQIAALLEGGNVTVIDVEIPEKDL